MATPSMLQSGLSRDLFEAWCEDPRNGVIIADFAVQGTLAREVLASPTEVTSRDGHKVGAWGQRESTEGKCECVCACVYHAQTHPAVVVVVMTLSSFDDPPQLALRMSVDSISFSAHADLPQTREFLDILRPQHVVLVHGELTEMFRLRKALEQHATQQQFSMEVLTPKNCQTLKLPFR